MPSPAFGSAGAQLQGTLDTTMNVDVPDNVAIGDLIVVTAMIDLNTFAGTTVTGLATDFVQAPLSPVNVAVGQAGVENRIYIMWKRATAADSTAGTYNFTLSAAAYRNAQAIRYTGVIDSGDPWDDTDSAESGVTNVTDSPAVSVTTTVSDTLLVWAASNWTGGSWTPPTGFTERRDTGHGVQTVADKPQAAAGSSGSVVGTCTASDQSGAWLGALMSPVAQILMPRGVIVAG